MLHGGIWGSPAFTGSSFILQKIATQSIPCLAFIALCAGGCADTDNILGPE